MLKLKEESATFYSSTVLAGYVTGVPAWDGPLVVAAGTLREGRIDIAHYTVLHEAGGYELIVPKGEYTLFAFGDANGNLTLDPGEPVGVCAMAPVRASGSGSQVSLDVVISNAPQSTIAPGTAVAARVPATPHSTQVGAIMALDDPLFSAQAGQRGYWAPVDFFREVGGNIYFLEEYDARKTPVLFVHGAAGSPQDWRYFLAHLDRSRYQPWIFHYPSGASLDSMSYLLYWKLSNLQRRYHYDKLYLTAHSMGGLVVRSFLSDYGDQFPAATLFVSLSTPWGGDALADQGIAYSPAVVPSWRDVRANGRFVQTLFRKPLPRELDYYLMFGHGGRYSLLRPASNDGVITLASQLRADAQAEARRVFGYDAGHVGILSSPEVFAQYAALLRAADQRGGDAPAAGKGKLRVTIAAQPGATPASASAPVLVLQPRDAARERIVVPVGARDSGRELGPFPPGAYQVSLLARGFRSTPAAVPVHIGPGAIPELAFTLAPQGTLSGYIGAEATSADNPAGSLRAERRGIVIESIVLASASERREIRPTGDTGDRTLEAYQAGQDHLFKTFFSFVGLAEGNYELTVNVAGYAPYRHTYRVLPGQPGFLTAIDLGPPR
ncbi:alpha/beta fold hydrolase [Massilia aquatica]|nr:alpha/beta fold hydrolase [Massilia aquatica]